MLRREPQGLDPCDVEACFTACSRRVIRAAIIAQIHEAEALGVGHCYWVSQMTAAVERLELTLASQAPARWDPVRLPADPDDAQGHQAA